MKMDVKKVLHMNTGDGETSYANNSAIQKSVISKTFILLDDTIEQMLGDHNFGLLKCFKIVDLGCSSGPNTLYVMAHIVDKIQELIKHKNPDKMLEFEVYLNDLSSNDFNNLFNLLSSYNKIEKQKRDWFVYGLPGSFYGRLFPTQSLHFAYSSYCIHWLSQVPEALGNNNKENICIAKESSDGVIEAYTKQFKRDFSTFLKLRGEEMISGGHMVLTLIGRNEEDPITRYTKQLILLAESLFDMVTERLIKLDDLYSFNIPFYAPCTEEVETLIQSQGSFVLDKIHVFDSLWDPNMNNRLDGFFDKQKSAKVITHCVRAYMEPLLASHFGSSNIDGLFGRFTDKVVEYLSLEEPKVFNISISLTKR